MSKAVKKEEEEVDADPFVVCSDATLRRYREAFAALDPAGEGSVSRADVGVGMRALGLAPSEAEVARLCDRLAPSGRADFRAFATAVHAQATSPHSRDAMHRAFRVFDPRGLGVLTSAEFRAVFETLGGDVRLEPQVVDALLEFADEGAAGQVEYGPFVDRLWAEHDRIKAEEKAAGGK